MNGTSWFRLCCLKQGCLNLYQGQKLDLIMQEDRQSPMTYQTITDVYAVFNYFILHGKQIKTFNLHVER